MMTYTETATWLMERDNFLFITHRRPDGDTLCSAAALCQGLRDLGKTAWLLKNGETTERYQEYVGGYDAPVDFVPETVVSVDTAGTNLLPYNIGDYAGRIDLAIDHHASHTPYTALQCVYGHWAACGEVVYHILRDMGVELSQQIAELLYIAITTDTGCFRYNNTKPQTLRICAELMERDVKTALINKKFFRTKSLPRILLESNMLANVHLHDGGYITVATITLDLMDKCGATEDDTDDIASVVGQIETSRVSITVREMSPGRCKISVRTWPEVNASDVCAILGGGGHAAAAGCEVDAGPEEAERLIVQAARTVIRRRTQDDA